MVSDFGIQTEGTHVTITMAELEIQDKCLYLNVLFSILFKCLFIYINVQNVEYHLFGSINNFRFIGLLLSWLCGGTVSLYTQSMDGCWQKCWVYLWSLYTWYNRVGHSIWWLACLAVFVFLFNVCNTHLLQLIFLKCGQYCFYVNF